MTPVALAMLLAVWPFAATRAAAGEQPAAMAARRWAIHAHTGVQYDSNVTLDPGGQRLPGSPADPADGAITLGAGGFLDVVDSDRAQVRLEYDLYQNLHFRLTDYDLRSNRIQATAGLALLPQLWLGTQAGFEHDALGGDGYSREPFVIGFLSLTEGEWGLTQLLYRHGDTTYLQAPFAGIRDGPTDVASLGQTVYWGTRYATAGYEFGSERPSGSTGEAQSRCVTAVSAGSAVPPCPGDYRFRSHQAWVGVGFAPGWRTSVEVMYVFRHERYTEPNSLTDFRTERRDDVSQLQLAVTRPLTPWLDVAFTYYGTFDGSNIGFYEYGRHIVSAELRLSY